MSLTTTRTRLSRSTLKGLLPVTRLSTTMHDSNNKDELRFDGVQNSVREDARETASDILIEDSPTFWSFQNSTDCVLNGLDESQGKLWIALCVVEGCRPVFLQRFRVEIPFHRRTAPRTFWRASSPGMASTRPLRTSS